MLLKEKIYSNWFIGIFTCLWLFTLFFPVLTPVILNYVDHNNPAARPAIIYQVWPTDNARPFFPDPLVYTAGGRNVAIWLKSERLRPECKFRHLKWYKGTRAENNVPLVVNVGKPLRRLDGAFDAGPWIIEDLEEWEIDNTFADVFHQCPRFGMPSDRLVKSRFYN